MLTTFDLDDYAYAALRAGASGFLLKDASAAEVSRRSAASTPATPSSPPSTTRRMLDHLSRGAPRQRDDHAVAALTDREREVLVEIAQGLRQPGDRPAARTCPRQPSRPTSDASWPSSGCVIASTS